MINITELKCEYRRTPLGIDEVAPRFSWNYESDERGQEQTAYRIVVKDEEENVVWDTKKVKSDEMNNIVYSGDPLQSFTRYTWYVQAWDVNGEEVPRVNSWFETAMLGGEFVAHWISLSNDFNPVDEQHSYDKIGRPSPYMRRSFQVDKKVKTARLYATALGIYEPYINGERVGNQYLTPGWTDYSKHVFYNTYDITDQIKEGENVTGVILGDGWYTGSVAITGRCQYGDYPLGYKAYLRIVYEDGSVDVIRTDPQWLATTGPILYNDLLNGEVYDARKELDGWCCPGYNAEDWVNSMVLFKAMGLHCAQMDEGVQVMHSLNPISVNKLTDGCFIIDMGQNMVGSVCATFKGQRGQVVRMRFGEILKEDGSLYTENLRSALQTDTYIMKGSDKETYRPRFTTHGFRYIEVTGVDEFTLNDIYGEVMYTANEATGKFECSSELVNKLFSNITWGQRGNFVDLPTDCPQRDERMGWSGDTQVFVRTGCYNMDSVRFYEKYIMNMQDAQHPDGAFTDVVPRVIWPQNDTLLVGYGNTAWGDAGIVVPWSLYRTYGDRRIVEENWEAMSRHFEYMKQTTDNLIRPGGGYGDWLSVGEETDTSAMNTAFFAYTARLMWRLASVMGKDEDEKYYGQMFDDIRAAFNEKFVQPDGHIANDTQTIYCMALHFGLLTPEKAKLAAKYLVDNIERRGGHLSTGFVGVGYLLAELSRHGYNDVAYKLITNTTYPSWGYSIVNGATTIWERWNSYTLDAGFGDVGMNSFNHYSLGSCGEWMYRLCAGIEVDVDNPGYKHFTIKPHVHPTFSHAGADYRSQSGMIKSHWEILDNGIRLSVTVPPNTSATVYVPARSSESEVTEGSVLAHKAQSVKFRGYKDGYSIYNVDSGNFVFTVNDNI